ncbi:hypothetical protein MKW98_005838, partial [Papaver atlanticum]
EKLKLEQQGVEKNPKSGYLSNMKPKSSAVWKGKKRTSDFSVELFMLMQSDTHPTLSGSGFNTHPTLT